VILGIDQGTTSTRAVVVDEDGRILARAVRGHAQLHPRDGWVEHDPAEIWRAVLAAGREAVEAAGGRRVKAVALANQGETVLLWDRETGAPVGNAIVWQDTRTRAWTAELARDAEIARRVREATGLRIDPYFSASKIRWLLDHAPGARSLAAAGRLACGTMDSWMMWKLSGGRSFVTDVSTAARTLLFDIRGLVWDPWLLELFGVPREILPDALGSVAPSEREPLAEAEPFGAPVMASLADQPAALAGLGCFAAGSIKATFGTGCFVYGNTGSAPAAADGLLATIAWRRRGETTYALDGGVLAAGSLLAWLRDDLGLAADDAALDRLAASGDGRAEEAGVVCVPAPVGLGAPHWDRSARAAWLGVGARTSRADLVRAAYHGVAARASEIVAAMQRGRGARVDALRVDGGLSASVPLMQAVADWCGLPVEVSDEPEATVLGACALAAAGAGLADERAILSRVRPSRRHEPSIDDDDRRRRQARFSAAVEAVRAFAMGSPHPARVV
jgi:glycerol kinase